MKTFDVTKKMSLAFLGAKWKEKKCNLEFNVLSIEDLTGDFAEISNVNPEEPESVKKGVKNSIKLLEDRFVAGTGISGGKVVKIVKEDIKRLPAEVLMKSVAFLSQGLAQKEEKQS